MARHGAPVPTLILASASPRRLDLLRSFGLDPVVAPADIDETPQPGEKPVELVERLARSKALAVRHGFDRSNGQPALVVAADTVIDLDGTVLGKPTDDADACRMLEALSGRSHDVVTGMAVVGEAGRAEVRVDRASVWMRSLGPDDLAWYVATGEPVDKAGAYAIQGLGSVLVDRVEGSYQSVVGLSIRALDDLTGRFGYRLRDLVVR